MISPKQRKCIELWVSGGLSQKEIAGAVKVSENTITNWKKGEEFSTELTAAQKAKIKDTAAKAFKREVDLLDAESEMVQLQAAKDILDRAGYKADDSVKVEHSGAVAVESPYDGLTTEELRQLAYGNSE